jgi:DNA-binding beta-propeller fold protein YncE
MAVIVQCPNPACKKSATVSEDFIGRGVRCRHCGQRFTLTTPTEGDDSAPVAPTVSPEAKDDTQNAADAAPHSLLPSGDQPPPTQPAHLTGLPEQIGRFQVRSRLGAGAFGTVYLAYDPQLDREVALKVPQGDTLDSPKLVQRFLCEAKAAARLRHSHIVAIHEAGYAAPHYYIASAFIEGRTLSRAIEEGKLTFRQQAEIVRDLAEALAYAHEKGIVHRDVKPANIMLDAGGQAHLMDFGLAHRQDSTQKLTQEGAFLGTPAYVAPEQAVGASGDALPVSDQYSVGVVLYEMLCGQPPFSGPPEIVIFNAIHREPAAPRQLNPQVPRDLETICLKAMSKQPAERYPSCQELADDLRRWLDGEPILARRRGPVERAMRWCRRNVVVVGLAAAVASLLVGVVISSYFAFQANRKAAEADLSRAEPIKAKQNPVEAEADADQVRQELERIKREAQRATEEAQSLKEEKRRNEEAQRLQEEKLKNKEAQRLKEEKRKNEEAQRLKDEEAKRKNQEEQRLKEEKLRKDALLYIDTIEKAQKARQRDRMSELLDSVRPERMGGVDRRGWEWHHLKSRLLHKDPEQYTPLTIKAHSGGVRCVAFSPDGGRVVSGGGDMMVKIWDAHRGYEVRTLRGHVLSVSSVAFSPKSRRLVSGSYDCTVKVWSADKYELIRTLKGHAKPVRSVAYHPDGKRIISGSEDGTVKVWDAETGEIQTLRGHTMAVRSVAYRPDGKRIISGSEDGTVKVWDAETGKEVQTLKGDASGVSSVAFSPDGKRIAAAHPGRLLNVWDAETGKETRWTAESNPFGPGDTRIGRTPESMAFSPDGTRIVVGGSWSGLKVGDAETGQELLDLQCQYGPVWSVAFSSDGKRIVSGSKDGTLSIWDGTPLEEKPGQAAPGLEKKQLKR